MQIVLALLLLLIVFKRFVLFLSIWISIALYKHCTAYGQLNGKTGSNSRILSRKNGKFIENSFSYLFLCAINLNIREIDLHATQDTVQLFLGMTYAIFCCSFFSLFYLFACWERKINIASPLNSTQSLEHSKVFALSFSLQFSISKTFLTHFQKWNNIEFNMCSFFILKLSKCICSQTNIFKIRKYLVNSYIHNQDRS